MKIEDMQKLMLKHDTHELEFRGKCHDCGKEVTVEIEQFECGDIGIRGGAIFSPKDISEAGENEANETVIEGAFLKCEDCFKFKSVLDNYQECERFSRVVGYLRPVKNWNKAKKHEFAARRMFHTVEI